LSGSLVSYYRSHPAVAAEELFGIRMPAAQRKVLYGIWNSLFSITVASRGFGKTMIAAVVAVLRSLLYPGTRVGLVSSSFRQAKIAFNEVEKLYERSSLFREATVKPPTRASDSCYVRFKSAGSKPYSWIEALPLADGSRIRGSRFHLVLADECVHIPENIFNTVIRPFGATSVDPMENVERLKRVERLKELGLYDPVSDEGVSSNQIASFTSGYFTFNYFYRLFQDYLQRMKAGDSDYVVFQAPYTVLPRGFLDEKNIENARSIMSAVEFAMEYLAQWKRDSDGLFKASVINACRSENTSTPFTVRMQGEPDKEYVMTVDPGRTGDKFAVTVAELGDPVKIVYSRAWQRKTFPQMAESIWKICEDFNIIEIHMDRGGGGQAIADMLADPDKAGKFSPILDLNDDSTFHKKGRRILKLVSFTPQWIQAANFGTVNLLEQKKILFPVPPRDEGEKSSRLTDLYESIQEMIRQAISVAITETPGGQLRFNLPTAASVGGQSGIPKHKDLYTTLILLGSLIKERGIRRAAENPLLLTGILVPR